jgi:hypothetical protein
MNTPSAIAAAPAPMATSINLRFTFIGQDIMKEELVMNFASYLEACYCPDTDLALLSIESKLLLK